jgi:UDP-N-acetyl-L-fucosamine synthase
MNKKINIITVVGTRPEIIRLSRIIYKFDKYFNHTLIHTGQNYDYELNEIFFKDLKIKQPNYYLNAAKDTSVKTIGNILVKIDDLIKKISPDCVFFLGDTNSALSAIAFKKYKIPIFHFEAGNRCFDMNVPEEINRTLVDKLADINLTYSDLARENLIRENFQSQRVIKIGSPMKEVIEFNKKKILKSNILNKLKLSKSNYFIISTHREENVENVKNFNSIIETADALSKLYKKKVIFNIHPRIKKKVDDSKIILNNKLIKTIKPLCFTDYIKLQKNALITISDSGTISEESSILGFKAINMRKNHERPEAMEEATVVLSGLNTKRIIQIVNYLINSKHKSKIVRDYNEDNVSEKVVKIILSYIDYINKYVWYK